MVSIATWNLENLFRPDDDGSKDSASYEANLTSPVRPSPASSRTCWPWKWLAIKRLAHLTERLDGDWLTVTKHPDGRGIQVGFIRP